MREQSFYGRLRWKRLRARKLAETPWCECAECRAHGRLWAASQVDHVVPISQGGEPWSWGNLQSLSAQCHSRKTWHEMRGRSAPVRGVCAETGRPLDPEHYWSANHG